MFFQRFVGGLSFRRERNHIYMQPIIGNAEKNSPDIGGGLF